MSFKFLWSVSLGLVACVSQRQVAGFARPPVGAEAQLHSLEDQWAEAYMRHDAGVLQRLLADDYIMTMNLGGLRSKAQYIAMVKNDTASNQTITRDEERIRVYGTAAVVTYKPTRVTHSVPHVFRTTDTWIFDHGRWQLVARQITDVPSP